MDERFWWVNHSLTHRQEIEGSYLWFARAGSRGKARGEFEKNVGRLAAGDVILSHAEGKLGAVGIVLGAAHEAAKPPELSFVAVATEADKGWLVPVRFGALPRPLGVEEHCAELAPSLPAKHSPIRANGTCNSHVVLAPVAAALVASVRRILDGDLERTIATITQASGRGFAEGVAEAAIQRRVDLSPKLKADLLRARQGQGTFRSNVESQEHSCRVTGLLDRRHLRATHIKPWSDCTDAEKLAGANGLLLSPHIAQLFERGYVTFADDGELLISEELNPAVLDSWRLSLPLNVGAFTPAQCHFLDHHRREVFGQHGGGRRRKLETSAAQPDASALETALLSSDT